MSDQSRGYRHPFVFGVHYFGGIGDYPRTVTDLAMGQCSAVLRQRPDWWTRFKDPAVRSEWTKEIRGRIWDVCTPSVVSQVQLSEKQINYALDELAGYEKLRDPQGRWQVSCFERIWESISFLDSHLLDNELSSLRSLNSVRNKSSTSTHLIDPYMYALIYNKTLVSFPRFRSYSRLPRAHSPSHYTTRTHPPPGSDVHTISRHSAFLPSTVFIPSSPGPNDLISFLSYINNLHPELHSSVYKALASLFTFLLPLFEHTLTDLHRNNLLMQRIPGTCRYTVWDEPEEPEFSDDDEGWTAYESELRHWLMNRPIRLPDVPEKGYSGGLEDRRHVVQLRGRTVQVVVDVTETELEPGDPPFPGTEWHVEGMRNERIVACGLFFASTENLTPSSIEFRMAVTYPRGFMAGDTGATLRTWGLRDGDPCHQYIGSRTVEPALALTFPNIYQHRQTAFSLLDSTKPGHQTIVSFFLVDPEIPGVLGTAEVAPQQRDWIRMAMDEAVDKRVPGEVLDQILDMVEGVMDDKEADKYACELREVRERFREANNAAHFCIPFDIWNAPEVSH